MICNLDNIKKIVKKDGLELLVVSYGGSGSNALVQALEKNGYKCKTPIWDKILCHCPHYIELDIPIIYIYDNPIKAFISMKNRGHGFWDTNQQKLSNNSRATGTHSGLMSLMISQFNSWTSIKRENVLIIKTSELFEASIVNKLKTFLKKDIKYFPLPYTPSKTNIENIKDANLVQVFKKYETEITRINNFTPPA